MSVLQAFLDRPLTVGHAVGAFIGWLIASALGLYRK